MVERPHDGPPPCAHPVPGGAPRLPDGDRVPVPPPPPPGPPLTRRQWAAGWLCVALVVAAVVIGLLR